MRRILTILVMLILGLTTVQAGNCIVKAEILTADAASAVEYRAIVEHNDTTIKQINGSFFERSLILYLKDRGKAVFTIDAAGYEKCKIDVNITDSILDLGNVVLKKELNIDLSEVTIKAKRIEIERMGAYYNLVKNQLELGS